MVGRVCGEGWEKVVVTCGSYIGNTLPSACEEAKAPFSIGSPHPGRVGPWM